MSKKRNKVQIELFDELGNLSMEALIAFAKGELDEGQSHEVKKLVEEDEMYADALEGVMAMQSIDATREAVADINERINDRGGNKRGAVIPLYVWRIAASVLLFLGLSGGIIYMVFNTDFGDNLAWQSEDEPVELAENQTKDEVEKTAKPVMKNEEVEPNTYQWSDSVNSSISNLAPGTYTVTVTDVNGSSATSEAVISKQKESITADEFFDNSGNSTTYYSYHDGTAIGAPEENTPAPGYNFSPTTTYNTSPSISPMRIADNGTTGGAPMQDNNKTSNDNQGIGSTINSTSGTTVATGNAMEEKKQMSLIVDPMVSQPVEESLEEIAVVDEDDNMADMEAPVAAESEKLDDYLYKEKQKRESLKLAEEKKEEEAKRLFAERAAQEESAKLKAEKAETNKQLEELARSEESRVEEEARRKAEAKAKTADKAAERSSGGEVADAKLNTVSDSISTVFKYQEQSAQFPGGEKAMYSYIRKNLSYPQFAKDNKKEGTVIVTFVVDEKGNITNAKVSRGIIKIMDDEALRVVKSMPKWKPAISNGNKVPAQMAVPVEFKLED